VELLGPYGLEKGLINLSNSIANLSTGNITTYALYILVGFIIYILTPYLYIIDNSLLLLLLLGLFYIKKKYYFSKLDKKDNFVLYNMQNNILNIFKRIKEKIFNKENIITVITYSIIIYIIRFCFIYFGIDVRLSYFLILLSKFSRDVVGEIVNFFFNYNNIKLPIGGDIDNSYTNKIIQKDNNKKLSNINTMCSDGSEPDVDMTDAPPIDSDSGNRSGSATPTLSRETTPTPASVAAAISARAALDSTVPIPPNNPNFNSNSSENSSLNAPPISMPIADAAQRIGAIRSLPTDFRIRNPYFSDNPAPGTLTPEAEDIFYNENEKKEHLVNMQKLRKQMYDISPIA
jgi:hypothetical protein